MVATHTAECVKLNPIPFDVPASLGTGFGIAGLA